MTIPIVGAIVRHALGALGAIGVVSDTEAEQLAGAIVVVISVGWSIYEKYQAKHARADVAR